MKPIREFSSHLKDRSFLAAFANSLGLLALALVVNYFAGTYASERVSNPVTDLVLSNIRVYDVDELFVYGAYALVVAIILVCLLVPRRLPFTVKSIALFYVIRSIFVSLTHIAPFPTHAIIDPTSYMRFFDFDGELFFSGHTGLPFLMALIFWDMKWVRVMFICLSVGLGAVVLLGHLHYSIDVFSAFFITYAIYGLAGQMFKRDKARGQVPALMPE